MYYLNPAGFIFIIFVYEAWGQCSARAVASQRYNAAWTNNGAHYQIFDIHHSSL